MTTTSPPASPRRRSSLVLALAIAVAVCIAVGAATLNRQPRRVATITVHNPTEFDITLDVTGAARDGWTSLTVVTHGETDTVQDVVDQGAEWIIRFRAQGVSGGELVTTRTALERQRWRVDIPTRVGDRLRAAGVPPAP